MTTKTYNKLVRDKVPDIIESTGSGCKFHIATDEEFLLKLKEKLLEEAQEFFDNPCVEELADIQEVLDTISQIHYWDVYGARHDKRHLRGTFWKRYVLDEVEEADEPEEVKE